MPSLPSLLVGTLLVLLLPGSPARASAPPLTVAAAASLQLVLREVAAAVAAPGSPGPTLVFGASGSLAHQLRNGAPYDVFASADAAWVRQLAAQGVILPDSVAAYAEGVLALAIHDPRRLAGQPAVLDAPALRAMLGAPDMLVALANPRTAPYGAAARETLRSAGLWAALRTRVVYGENVRQALTYVETGNADAGLVAASLLGASAAPARPIAAVLHPPIHQYLGIAARSPRRAAARAFIAYLLGPQGRAILLRHGLRPPLQGAMAGARSGRP